MIATEHLPTIEELHEFIDSVPKYPVTARGLVELAAQEGAGRRVIDFYRTFPHDQVFYSSDDLVARSEVVEMMNEEEAKQPVEYLRSPQE